MLTANEIIKECGWEDIELDSQGFPIMDAIDMAEGFTRLSEIFSDSTEMDEELRDLHRFSLHISAIISEKNEGALAGDGGLYAGMAASFISLVAARARVSIANTEQASVPNAPIMTRLPAIDMGLVNSVCSRSFGAGAIGKELNGKDRNIAPMINAILSHSLEFEMTEHFKDTPDFDMSQVSIVIRPEMRRMMIRAMALMYLSIEAHVKRQVVTAMFNLSG